MKFLENFENENGNSTTEKNFLNSLDETINEKLENRFDSYKQQLKTEMNSSYVTQNAFEESQKSLSNNQLKSLNKKYAPLNSNVGDLSEIKNSLKTLKNDTNVLKTDVNVITNEKEEKEDNYVTQNNFNVLRSSLTSLGEEYAEKIRLLQRNTNTLTTAQNQDANYAKNITDLNTKIGELENQIQASNSNITDLKNQIQASNSNDNKYAVLEEALDGKLNSVTFENEIKVMRNNVIDLQKDKNNITNSLSLKADTTDIDNLRNSKIDSQVYHQEVGSMRNNIDTLRNNLSNQIKYHNHNHNRNRNKEALSYLFQDIDKIIRFIRYKYRSFNEACGRGASSANYGNDIEEIQGACEAYEPNTDVGRLENFVVEYINQFLKEEDKIKKSDLFNEPSKLSKVFLLLDNEESEVSNSSINSSINLLQNHIAKLYFDKYNVEIDFNIDIDKDLYKDIEKIYDIMMDNIENRFKNDNNTTNKIDALFEEINEFNKQGKEEEEEEEGSNEEILVSEDFQQWITTYKSNDEVKTQAQDIFLQNKELYSSSGNLTMMLSKEDNDIKREIMFKYPEGPVEGITNNDIKTAIELSSESYVKPLKNGERNEFIYYAYLYNRQFGSLQEADAVATNWTNFDSKEFITDLEAFSFIKGVLNNYYNIYIDALKGIVEEYKETKNQETQENFTNYPSVKPNIVNSLLKAVLYGCIFFILSHKDVQSYVLSIIGKKNSKFVLVVLMAVFIVLYYVLNLLL